MRAIFLKTLLLLAVVLPLLSCEQAKFNSTDGTNNQPWAQPAAFERQGAGSPLGMGGMFPGSR